MVRMIICSEPPLSTESISSRCVSALHDVTTCVAGYSGRKIGSGAGILIASSSSSAVTVALCSDLFSFPPIELSTYIPCVPDRDAEYSPEAPPPTLFTTALEWRGRRNGLRAVIEVEIIEYSRAASVRMP